MEVDCESNYTPEKKWFLQKNRWKVHFRIDINRKLVTMNK